MLFLFFHAAVLCWLHGVFFTVEMCGLWGETCAVLDETIREFCGCFHTFFVGHTTASDMYLVVITLM